MAPADDAHRLYSCDDHLDIFNVPRDLWERRLPQRYRERGPRVIERKGHFLWMVGDRTMGPSGSAAVPSALSRVDVEDDGFRPSNPKLRMEDMERDGIHASIVYGPAALFAFPIDDPEHMRAALCAWNDWAAEEFNAYLPDRLNALPFLPTDSPAAAVEELQRCAARGHRGAILSPFEANVGDPAWDALWAAAAEAQLPLSFHIGGGSRIRPLEGGWRIPAYASIAPVQMDEPLAVMVFSGALRAPGLRHLRGGAAGAPADSAALSRQLHVGL
jgi:predicted TIM-barrel fold metal-dependent hydrolase